MAKHQALYCILCFAAGVAVTIAGLYIAGMVEFNKQSATIPQAPAPHKAAAPAAPRAGEAPPAGAAAPAATFDAWQTKRLSEDHTSRGAAAQQLQALLTSDKDDDKLTGWTYIYSFWSKAPAGGRVATADEFWSLMREINLGDRIAEGAKSANPEVKKQADAAKSTFTPWRL
jgi:hypothetical protein